LDSRASGNAWPGWIRAQDLVWLLLFSALALASPHRNAAEFEVLAAFTVLQIAAPRIVSLSTAQGNAAVIALKLILGFLLIGVTGGILSGYYLILLLPVLSAATTLGPAGTTLTTLLACVTYLLFLPLAYSLGYDLDPDILRDVSLRVVFLPVVGYLTYQLAEANRNEALRAQQAAEQLAAANLSLKEAEAAVRRSERLAALGQLTAGLAHELRNPMGTMKASAELLQQKIGEKNPIAQELAGYISTEVDRTNSLISRFLEFARPLQLRRKACDLNELTDRVVAQLGRRNPPFEVEFHKNLSPDVPPLQLDEELMERVLVNLLSNAAQASSPGGTVTIKTRATPGWAEVAVIDRGSGIEPALREQIFNPFFTTKQDGVGLGLAIVSKIVDEHGGHIAVESEVGKGSTFRIQVPSVY
jgi:two-component system sensor histidine kinase HydH